MKQAGKIVVIFCLAALFAAGSRFSLTASADTVSSTTASGASSTSAAVLTRDELAQQVQDKAQQLDAINQQLEATKQNLQGTKQQRLTLQQALATIQNNINELNLNVQADNISIQKLNLEVESLNLDMQDIQTSIVDKKAAIGAVIQQIQQSDMSQGNLLTLFLRSGSLADGVLEAQNYRNLQIQLTADIGNLQYLNDQYNQAIAEAASKKSDIAVHQENLQNRLAIVQDQKSERQQLLQATKNKESLYQQQFKDLQQQQQEIADEIETLDAVLRTKIDPSTLPAPGHGVLYFPAQANMAGITQDYGSTTFAETGYHSHWHNGVDIGVPIGTPIYAAEDGTVVATGNQDAYCYHGAYGKFIVIQHNDNLVTLYGHLSRQIAKKGDIVKRGQTIGYSGQTGYATGPHLHFTVFAGPTFYMGPSKACGPMPYGGDLNPLSYL